MFHRLQTDGTETSIQLQHHYAGPIASACWLIGGGPSLNSLPCDEIQRSPIPRMAINLAGAQRIRPNFWTSYDPSARFHRSVYLDPGITKFLHRRRAMDLVPESTFKVCECPNTLFFERDAERGYAEFLHARHNRIVDWADSFVQAIDLLYQLGFRIVYLAGCEMRVRPSPAQIARAELSNIVFSDATRLDEWLAECRRAGISEAELNALDPAPQYHFDEHKPMAAAARTDQHYFRIAQSLRLSRRAIALAGLQLISITPGSRLNDYFPYRPCEQVLADIHQSIGDPRSEPTRGLYSRPNDRRPASLGPMRDYRPHDTQPRKNPSPDPNVTSTAPDNGHRRLKDRLESLPRELPPPVEIG